MVLCDDGGYVLFQELTRVLKERDEALTNCRQLRSDLLESIRVVGAVSDLDQFVESLFTNGSGEVADRLVLTKDTHAAPPRDLGGWCREAIGNDSSATIRYGVIHDDFRRGVPMHGECEEAWYEWDDRTPIMVRRSNNAAELDRWASIPPSHALAPREQSEEEKRDG